MQIQQKRFLGWLIAGLLGGYLPAQAAPTDQELALLPPYCHAVYKNDETAIKYWRQQLGQNMGPIGHYCNGLNGMNKARFALDKSLRRRYLGQAINEFEYCAPKWPVGSPLIPEARQKKAEAEAMVKLIK